MHVSGIPPNLTAVYQQFFTAADKDADGKISQDELQSARNTLPSQAKGAAKGHSVDKMFTKLDTNADGFLTPDELTPRLSRGAFSVLLAAQEQSGALSPHGKGHHGVEPPAEDPAPPVSDPLLTPPVSDPLLSPPVSDPLLSPPVTSDATPPASVG